MLVSNEISWSQYPLKKTAAIKKDKLSSVCFNCYTVDKFGMKWIKYDDFTHPSFAKRLKNVKLCDGEMIYSYENVKVNMNYDKLPPTNLVW